MEPIPISGMTPSNNYPNYQIYIIQNIMHRFDNSTVKEFWKYTNNNHFHLWKEPTEWGPMDNNALMDIILT